MFKVLPFLGLSNRMSCLYYSARQRFAANYE
jgi:hypothetical protein